MSNFCRPHGLQQPHGLQPVSNFCDPMGCSLQTPWTPLSIGFSRQEYWSGLSVPSPGDLPDPGIEPGSFALQVDSLLTELWGLQAEGSACPKAWRHSETLQQAAAGVEAGEVGGALPLRDHDHPSKRLRFPPKVPGRP